MLIDFETRAYLKLQLIGASVYAQHPYTDWLCCAWGPEDEEREQIWLPWDAPPPELLEAINDPDETFYAHNAPFEMDIWHHIVHKRYGWPDIPLERWECLAARCAAAGLPRKLEKAAEVIGVPGGKDMEGHAVMMKLCKPRRETIKQKHRWHTDFHEYHRLYQYCLRDVSVERAVYRCVRPLPPEERKLWQIDQTINRRGIPIDVHTVRAVVNLNNQFETRLTKELARLTNNHVTTGGQVSRMIEWLNLQDVNISDMRKGTVDEHLARPGYSPRVQRVLWIRKYLSRSSIGKFAAMAREAEVDNRVRGSHLYHSAVTGRWASKRVQFQNIPHGSVKDPEKIEQLIRIMQTQNLELLDRCVESIPDAFVSVIRSMVQAQRGRLIIVDFAQIEARVNAWLAGQRDMMEIFARDEDVYKATYAKLAKIPLADVDKYQRQLGKICVLALGYGMGWARFQTTCLTYGVELEEEPCKQLVASWREAHPQIVQFWKDLENAALTAMRNPGRRFYAGRIGYTRKPHWLECHLPSGRVMSYINPRLEKRVTPWGAVQDELTYMGVDSQTHQWKRLRSHGPKLCENVVQATARDFQANGLIGCEENNYPVVMHVHDEIVSEREGGTVEGMVQIMTDLPKWGKGCPIAAAGFEAARYRKD